MINSQFKQKHKGEQRCGGKKKKHSKRYESLRGLSLYLRYSMHSDFLFYPLSEENFDLELVRERMKA